MPTIAAQPTRFDANRANSALTSIVLAMVHADVREAFPGIKNLWRACGVTRTGTAGGNKQFFAEIDVPDPSRKANPRRRPPCSTIPPHPPIPRRAKSAPPS